MPTPTLSLRSVDGVVDHTAEQLILPAPGPGDRKHVILAHLFNPSTTTVTGYYMVRVMRDGVPGYRRRIPFEFAENEGHFFRGPILDDPSEELIVVLDAVDPVEPLEWWIDYDVSSL